MITLDALGPNGPYKAHNRLPIADVAGNPLAELSLVPELFVTRAMSALRKAEPLPLRERLAAIAAAGELFATGEVAGLTAAEYEHTVSRMAGTPLPVVRAAAETIAKNAAKAYYWSLQAARPMGAVNDWRDPLIQQGAAVWIRRGEVFAVHAAGNNQAAHAQWLEAVAAGYRVAIRPSRREPLTPHRLVSALRACGIGQDQVVLLPTDHKVADQIPHQADLSMVYGGQEVIDKYATNPTVLPNGPGRSKILITAETNWQNHLDLIVDSTTHQGGTACVNATAVFVEGDPAPLAAAVAERLAAIPSLPPEDEKAVLTAYSPAAATAMTTHVSRAAKDARPHLEATVETLPDGSAVPRPAVYELPTPHAPQAQIEMGFPCVWIAPWTQEAGVAPLRNSLALTAVTRNERLLDALLAEPTIRNLYIGDHPTYWMTPGVPHDGFLGEFLMRSKAVIRDKELIGS